MIFFLVTSTGPSFSAVLDGCKLADKLGFGVQLEVLDKTLQIPPGTNPHIFYKKAFPEFNGDEK